MNDIKDFLVNNRNKCYIILFTILFLGFGIFVFNYYRGSSKLEANIVELSNGNDFSSGSVIVADNKEFDSDNVVDGDYGYLIEGDFLSDNFVSDEEKLAMDQNTKYLQNIIDNAKEGQTIKIPNGIFYFSSGGINERKSENYVIKLRSNISIVGAGTDEESSNNCTILKPYASDGTIEHGLDMFYWNELADSYGANPLYLNDVNFSDFIIDGEDVRGNTYNSSGKGFMINLCRDCDWYNIVVRNTDATGFGMDNVINGTVINCIAVNCGKNAKTTSTGASGFGIGTGYSDEESMYFKNCKSIGNNKFGFFFEHQGLFSDYYNALKSEGFVVEDSYASGNLYNYGGERANDVIYINCKSDDKYMDDSYTKMDIYFSEQSRRVSVIDFNTSNFFTDVNNSSRYYYTPVNWSLKNNITNGISRKKFGIGQYVTRAEAIMLLWRMTGREGNVLGTNDLSINSRKVTNLKTGFSDVAPDSLYANPIKWARDEGIITGVTNESFKPNDNITRAQFVTMLWRYAGCPIVDSRNNFVDVAKKDYFYDAVNWAYSKEIVMGISDSKFSPSSYCTREQVVTFLYRYQNSSGINFPISYLLFNGSVKANPDYYLSGTDEITLNNPIKDGYTFIGWTGSNGNDPLLNVKINKNDVGIKKFIANYTANRYEISYDSNGGSGLMSNTKAVYDRFVKLEENKFTKAGFVFMGWALEKDGNVIYSNNDIVKNLTSDNGKIITLYAIWE